MSPSRPSLHRYAAPLRWQLLAALCCALLLACAPSEEGTVPAAEEEPAQGSVPLEDQEVEEAETRGTEQVAVELPGLPVGGSAPPFSRTATSACVQVNWTAGTLLDGVRVLLREVEVQAPFAEWAGPCAPPCEGRVLTAGSSTCEVGVTVADPGSAPVTAQLGVTAAALVCDSPALCEQTLSLIRERGPATIDLELLADTGETGTDENGTGENGTGESSEPEGAPLGEEAGAGEDTSIPADSGEEDPPDEGSG